MAVSRLLISKFSLMALRQSRCTNSSSMNLPHQMILISFLFHAKKEMSRSVAGSAISPYGQASPVHIDMNIHRSEPARNRQRQVMIYTLVERVVSNLRMQDIRAPGQMIAVTGSQAHFWLYWGLTVGICSQKGQLKVLRMKVLQGICFTQQMTTQTSYTVMVIPKQVTACFRDTNLRNFIAAMMMAMEMTSLMTQFLPENHQPKHTPRLTPRLITSITLTTSPAGFLTALKVYTQYLKALCSRNRISLLHSHTEASPHTHDSTVTVTLTTSWCPKQITSPPMTSSTLNPHTMQMLSCRPVPPSDQAYEYTDPTVMVTAANTIMIRSPYSMLAPEKLVSQYMQYWNAGVRPEMLSRRISKQLPCVSVYGQLLARTRVQLPGWQVVDVRARGAKLPYLVDRLIWVYWLRLVSRIWQVELVFRYSALVCRYVYRGDSEQSNSPASCVKLLLKPEAWLNIWTGVGSLACGDGYRVISDWQAVRVWSRDRVIIGSSSRETEVGSVSLGETYAPMYILQQGLYGVRAVYNGCP